MTTIPEQQKPLVAVGLDWDDLLANTHDPTVGGPRTKALRYAFEKLKQNGFEPKPGITPDSRQKDETDEIFLRRAYGNEEAVRKGLEYVVEYYETGIYQDLKLIDGARETLRFLRDVNIPFFIATNGKQKRAEERFKHFFGEEFPEVSVIGKDEEHGVPQKPDPAMLLKGFEKLGLKPGQTKTFLAYVGDSVKSDVTAAVRAGVHPILFHSEFSAAEQQHKDQDFARVTRRKGKEPCEVTYNGKRYPISFAVNHQQLRYLLFSEKDKRVSKDIWWEGKWWKRNDIMDGIVHYTHQLLNDEQLKQHHLVMIGGSTEWLAYTAFQLTHPQDRNVITVPFSTKKSPVELKRQGFADEPNRVARFVPQKISAHDESLEEKKRSYRRMLDLYGLTPGAMVAEYRKSSKKYALVDCVGKGKGLATFVYFLVQWAQEEAAGAHKNDPKFLDDFMASITPLAIAAEPNYRHHYTHNYKIFHAFTVQGVTLPGNQPIPVVTHVNNTANMLGFCKYPRLTPKYPYHDWSDKPYFRDDLSWLEENLVNEVMSHINKAIERAHEKRVQPAASWAEYVKKQAGNLQAGGAVKRA